MYSRMDQLAKGSALDVQIQFIGRQDNAVLYYQAASLMVDASRRESFGLAILEAMSCGFSVVATKSAGPNETVRTGRLEPWSTLKILKLWSTVFCGTSTMKI